MQKLRLLVSRALCCLQASAAHGEDKGKVTVTKCKVVARPHLCPREDRGSLLLSC